MSFSSKTKINLIIGDPVKQSLSPILHNAGYEFLGINEQFVYLASEVKPENLSLAMDGVRALGINGLACTIPHKVAVINYLDDIDLIAGSIGAVNTVLNRNGHLTGYNTDWYGTLCPIAKYFGVNLEISFLDNSNQLNRQIPQFLKDKTVALLGAGGAARAMAMGVLMAGARVEIFNRTVEKAEEIARDFQNLGYDCFANSLEKIARIAQCQIVLNSTSLGMGKNEGETAVPEEFLNTGQIAFDAVYKPMETRFLKEAKEQGCTIIQGAEMLLYQAFLQFEIHTGYQAPREVMRKALLGLSD